MLLRVLLGFLSHRVFICLTTSLSFGSDANASEC